MWNCDYINVHAPSLFQSFKMYGTSICANMVSHVTILTFHNIWNILLAYLYIYIYITLWLLYLWINQVISLSDDFDPRWLAWTKTEPMCKVTCKPIRACSHVMNRRSCNGSARFSPRAGLTHHAKLLLNRWRARKASHAIIALVYCHPSSNSFIRESTVNTTWSLNSTISIKGFCIVRY